MTTAEALKSAQDDLKKAQEAFNTADETVRELEDKLDAAQRERSRLSHELNLAGARLDVAWRAHQNSSE